MRLITAVLLAAAVLFNPVFAGELAWPLACDPRDGCVTGIGFPDIDNDGTAFDCTPPG